MAVDNDLLKALTVMEELQYDGVIDFYIYDSKEGEITFKAFLEYEYYDKEQMQHTLHFEEVEKKEILAIIKNAQREFAQFCIESEIEAREYREQLEHDYWYVQGVSY